MSNRKTIKQRFRAFKTSIRQRLFKGLEWAQFYIYDPSKPSKAEFLKISLEDQAAWIEANIPEHETKLYGDGL